MNNLLNLIQSIPLTASKNVGWQSIYMRRQRQKRKKKNEESFQSEWPKLQKK